MLGPWLETQLPVLGSDPVHPLNRGRLAWWLTLPPTDGGRQWYDLVGLNHGVLTNSVAGSGWRGTTRPGGAGHILFAGGSDYVALPVTAASFPDSRATAAAWFKHTVWPVVDGNQAGIWCLGTGEAVTTAPSHFPYSDGLIYLATFSSSRVLSGYAPVADLSGWFFVTVTTEPGTGNYKLYINGRLETTATNSAFTFATAPAIGQSSVSTVFGGSADDLGLWNRVLSAAEVKSLYDASRAGYPGVLTRVAAALSPLPPIVPGPWLETSLPVLGSDPGHSVNRGLAVWWLTLPPTDGGRQWYDLSGLNHGVLANFGAGFGWHGTTRPGGFGQLTFDSVAGSEVDPPSAAPFPSGGAARTYALWSNTTSTALKVWFDHGDPNVLNSRFLIYDSGNGFVTLEYHGGSVVGTRGIVDGAWHHVAVTYDGATIAIYVDGTLDVSSTGFTLTTVASVPKVGGPWSGPIDDFRAYSRALSAADVKALFDASRAGYPGALTRVAVAPGAATTPTPGAGAAALAATATVTAVAGLKVPGAAALSGTAAVTATASVTGVGAAALAGVATLTATGRVAIPGASVLAGASSVTATASLAIPGTVAAAAVSTLTATAGTAIPGASALAGIATLTATPKLAIPGAASLSQSATLTAVASLAIPGAASLGAASTLTPVAGLALPGTAPLTAASTATSTAALAVPGASALAGVATLTATGRVAVAGTAALAGVSTITASAAGQASAALAGSATLTATPKVAVAGTAALAGSASLTPAASLAIPGASAVASTATLTATGTVPGVGAASLAGASTLTAVAGLKVPGAAALSQSATLTAVASLAIPGAAALGDTAALTATAALAIPGVAALASASTLTTSAGASVAGTASLAGTATLTATGRVAIPGAATLGGVVTLTAGAGTAIPGVAALAAASTVASTAALALPGASALGSAATLTATAALPGVAVLNAASVLVAVPSLAITGAASIAGNGTLGASSRLAIPAAAAITGAAKLTARLRPAGVGVTGFESVGKRRGPDPLKSRGRGR